GEEAVRHADRRILESSFIETFIGDTGRFPVRLLSFRLLLFLPLLLAGPALLVVSSGTRMIQRWVAPDVANYKFDHILTICIIKDQSIRQTVEDAMAARVKKGNAFPSYNK